MLRKNKKGQPTIIATVLLILLVIVAATVIFTFVLPFVKERMSKENCLDVVGQVEISSGYTCYNGSAMQVQVHITEIRDLISGFSVELGGATTKSYKITNNTATAGVMMCGETAEGNLELPGDNEERTYVITADKPNIIRIYPILAGGKACDVSDTATVIEACSSFQAC